MNNLMKLGDLLPGEWFVCAAISHDDVWVKSSGVGRRTDEGEFLCVSLFSGEARYIHATAQVVRMVRVDPRSAQEIVQAWGRKGAPR